MKVGRYIYIHVVAIVLTSTNCWLIIIDILGRGDNFALFWVHHKHKRCPHIVYVPYFVVVKYMIAGRGRLRRCAVAARFLKAGRSCMKMLFANTSKPVQETARPNS